NVPSRTHGDREAEYVTALGLNAATAAKIGNEIYVLMKQEFAEASEPVPAGTVGSSTMPQKRNPILCQDVVSDAARIRSVVPLALEAMMTEHEANRATSTMMRAALTEAAVRTGDILARLIEIAEGMTLDPTRMYRNLDLTGGMILSEAIMMELGETMGRQVAHDLVYDAVEKVREGSSTFADALTNDPQIREQLGNDGTARLTNPSVYTGLCSDMARAQAAVARNVATELKALTA
ncbi:MAG: lyase family protein, partial [Pseudomonadota bacterium]